MTEVVLIPCSGRKRDGGTSGSPEVPPLTKTLSARAWADLSSARSQLADILGLEPGPDLGSSAAPAKAGLLPAFRRYSGNLYHNARLAEGALAGTRRVFIISALYGLLDALDPVRKYDLQMSDTLPGRVAVKRWWRDHDLLNVVIDLVSSLRPTRVHDLLSGNYRDALRGLPGRLPSATEYRAYEYPGLGSGADYHRGDDLRELLSGS